MFSSIYNIDFYTDKNLISQLTSIHMGVKHIKNRNTFK